MDDDPGVRASLSSLMESVGIGVETYATAAEFLSRFDPGRPGCLLLDIRLRRTDGLGLQDELRRRRATLPIIVITGYANVSTSVRALKSGAFDFLEKPVSPNLLLERVHAALEKDRIERVAAGAHAAVTRRLAGLTPREREVLNLLLEGKISKEIARILHISVRTVEGHRQKVLSKMRVSTAAELVRVVLSVPSASRSHGVPQAH